MTEHEYVKRPDGSVINTNSSEYQKYKIARERAIREKDLTSKVDKLEQEMTQIKDLLVSISSRI